MNTKQSIVAWLVSVVVYISIVRVIQQHNFYTHGYRAEDKAGNIIRFSSVGRRDIWNDAWKKPLINSIGTLGVGGLLVYVLRDKKK